MSCTRSDIAFAVSKLNRYISNPDSDHWKTIVRVMRYLMYTHDLGLHYTRYQVQFYCKGIVILIGRH